MTENKPEKEKDANPTSEQQNWEQRIITEMNSSSRWNENWGSLFSGTVPNDLKERQEYLEAEIARMKSSSQEVPRNPYGFGQPIKEVGKKDFRRKKMFQDDLLDD